MARWMIASQVSKGEGVDIKRGRRKCNGREGEGRCLIFDNIMFSRGDVQYSGEYHANVALR